MTTQRGWKLNKATKRPTKVKTRARTPSAIRRETALSPQNTIHCGKHATLYVGDALEVMAALAPETFDLIFADPPYNLSNGGITCQGGRMVSVDKGHWDKSQGIEADFAFHSAWIAACKRLLKPNGSLWISGTYHSIYACGFALQEQGWHIVNDIAWFKPNASPNLSCRMFTASHETLIWARKSKKAKHLFNYPQIKNGSFPDDFLKKEKKQMRSVWAIYPPSKEEKRFGRHPTQKPEALLTRIIAACTNTGGKVLDPFCGSGTTGVAAIELGRHFVGIDQDRDYVQKLAKLRIGEASKD